MTRVPDLARRVEELVPWETDARKRELVRAMGMSTSDQVREIFATMAPIYRLVERASDEMAATCALEGAEPFTAEQIAGIERFVPGTPEAWAPFLNHALASEPGLSRLHALRRSLYQCLIEHVTEMMGADVDETRRQADELRRGTRYDEN